MLFNSSIFLLLFLPVCFFGFVVLRHFALFNVGMFWLVLCSLFFYAWWNPVYLTLIVGSIIVNYAIGYRQGHLFQNDRPSRKLMVLSIILNLGLLGYFKYANFFVDNVNAVFASNINIPEVILPLAISFFTFQQITYQVDAYRGETKEYNFLHYCLFVTFFPQLIAGPIVHHKEMMPQFASGNQKTLNPNHVVLGLVLLSMGLFKKVVIADNLAQFSTPVFSAAQSGQAMTFFESWGGALAYTFQIYFDFSGYSDMAIGLGCFFGIVLPLNFFSPYRALNIIEFWRRWHITLSRFLRDYVYIPLGGNRKGNVARYRNLLLTMIIGGVWHGAGWTFVFWGLLHGLYLIANHGWHAVLRKFNLLDKSGKNIFYRTLAWGVTFTAVVVAWVFFRAESYQASFTIIDGMRGLNGAVLDYRLEALLPFLKDIVTFEGTGIGSFSSVYGVAWIIFAAMIALFMPNIYQMIGHARDTKKLLDVDDVLADNKIFKFLCVVAPLFLLIALSRIGAPTEFLYFDF